MVDRRFNAADESCSDPASAVYFGCVVRYYFLATFEARTWRHASMRATHRLPGMIWLGRNMLLSWSP